MSVRTDIKEPLVFVCCGRANCATVYSGLADGWSLKEGRLVCPHHKDDSNTELERFIRDVEAHLGSAHYHAYMAHYRFGLKRGKFASADDVYAAKAHIEAGRREVHAMDKAFGELWELLPHGTSLAMTWNDLTRRGNEVVSLLDAISKIVETEAISDGD